MAAPSDQLIEAIQISGYRSVWMVTGGGIGAVRLMLIHPGASRFISDVRIPYSEAALADCLPSAPDSSCSEETARRMALKALESGTLGIACTAALRTNRERKGADRAHICFKTADREFYAKIDLPHMSREQQDEHLSHELVCRLADFLGIDL